MSSSLFRDTMTNSAKHHSSLWNWNNVPNQIQFEKKREKGWVEIEFLVSHRRVRLVHPRYSEFWLSDLSDIFKSLFLHIKMLDGGIFFEHINGSRCGARMKIFQFFKSSSCHCCLCKLGKSKYFSTFKKFKFKDFWDFSISILFFSVCIELVNREGKESTEKLTFEYFVWVRIKNSNRKSEEFALWILTFQLVQELKVTSQKETSLHRILYPWVGHNSRSTRSDILKAAVQDA